MVTKSFHLNFVLVLCFIAALFSPLFAQEFTLEPTQEPTVNGADDRQTLEEQLALSLNPISPGLLALFPPSIIGVETPVAIRYVLLSSVAPYQIWAACDPVALSFLGTKDPANPDKVCDPLSRLIIYYQLNYRLLQPEFPREMQVLSQFLVSVGLNPFDETTDPDTPIGWANANAIKLREYFDNDGWNALGDETKQFYRFPFQDTSGYLPQNNPFKSPMDLPRPLRWQPLPFTDFRGRFGHQIHVTPHVGINVKPLVLSMEDFESRKAPSPYKFPNTSMEIDPEDEQVILERLDKVFEQTRTLNDERIGLAFWWENKFFSLGSFILFYAQKLGLDQRFGIISALGEMMAQHDAVLVAWKEKRRHDLVRPVTMVRRLLAGKQIDVYRGVDLGNGMMPADEWEPLLQTQPHSEYPSGSAVVCMASLERLQVDLEEVVGPNGTIPPFEGFNPAGSIPNNPVEKDLTFRFNTLKEAALSCGESRLYGGVHFEPSVTEGIKLGEGIGKAAFEHLKDLMEGRVPKNCMRCKKQ